MTLNSQPSEAICLQGHRGWRGKFPENSKLAFERVIELGVSAIELDIVPGPEGSLWVWHDPYLGPLFDGDHDPSKALQSYSIDELEASVFGLKAHPQFPMQERTACQLMQLPELMEWWISLGPERVWLNIEIKSKSEWEPVFQAAPTRYAEDVLKALGTHTERVHIQSFDQRILTALNALKPGCSLGLLIEKKADLQKFIQQPFQVDALGIAHQLLNADDFAAIRELGIEVMVWTVNDLDEADRLHAIGIRNFITDHPERFLEWMEDKGVELRRTLIA